MPILDTPTYTWISAVIDLAAIVGAWWLGRLLSHLLARGLLFLTRRTKTAGDDIIVDVLGKAVPWLTAALAAVITIRVGPATPRLIDAFDLAAKIAVTLTLTFTLASLLAELMQKRVLAISRVGTTTLTRKLLYWIIVVVGCVVVLTELGVEITPVLAALGVGSLAVGLALQPTLSNVFAGFNLTLAQRLRIGDFVRLESGQEGRVVDIGWRSTEIRSIGESIVLVPNAKLAEIIVTNFSLPSEESGLLVELTVGYDADLDHVERVVLDIARRVQAEAAGATREHEPSLRYLAFGDSAIRFVTVLRARSFPDRVTVTHEFLKRVKARFDEEGIPFPYPQRIVRTIGAPAPAGGDPAA